MRFPLVEEDEDTLMSTRFDRRLKEAGLLKHSDTSTSSPSSSTEDLMRNSDDPGYARLAILPSGPILFGKKKKPPKQVEEEEGGYANPADAIRINPHVQHINQQHFSNSPSPPSSPVVPPERPPKSPVSRASGYESVDEIRKMREKQLKEKDEKRENTGQAQVTETGSKGPTNLFHDDDPGYSRPFDAIKGRDAASKKPPSSLIPWQRTGSNGKGSKEPSAKFLHLVGASSPVGVGKKSPVEDTPKDYVSPVGSSSTSAKVALKAVGRRHTETTALVGSKSGNQTFIERSPKVNRFILTVDEGPSGEPEDGKPNVRETGRSQSVSSILSSSHTPAKITKLRTGHVTVISGKTAGTAIFPKNDKQ